MCPFCLFLKIVTESCLCFHNHEKIFFSEYVFLISISLNSLKNASFKISIYEIKIFRLSGLKFSFGVLRRINVDADDGKEQRMMA